MPLTFKKRLDAIKNRVIWRKSEFCLFIAIAFIFLSLKKPIMDFFNDILVAKIFSAFSSQPYGISETILYLVLLSFSCWWLYYKTWKGRIQVSIVIIFSIFSAGCIYIHERITDLHYDFYPIHIWDQHKLAQADPLFALMLIVSVILICNFFRNLEYPENNTFFLQDLPLKNSLEDQFNRGSFYTEVLKKLKEIAFDTEKGFAMGLNSTWGYGKTSLLELIREDFKKDNYLVCVNYNPWLSSSKQGLTLDFFTVLEDELSNYINNADILLEYGKKVSKFDNEANPLKAISDYFEVDKTLEKRFKKISELIKQTGKKFYIIIDDLDRLDNDEVFEVLRLIRNVANFPRLHYIVAYDRQYVINALTRKKIYDPKNYLEKIFELEIELPKIEDAKIRALLHTIMQTAIKKIQLPNADLLEVQGQLTYIIFNAAALTATKIVNISSAIPEAFKTKRDMIKFANSFFFSFSLNKDQVYLPDLFALELIKLSNIALYDHLSLTDNYLDIYDDGNGTPLYYQLFERPALPAITALNASRENLNSVLQKSNIKWQQKLIQSLFTKPELSDFRHTNSIVFKDKMKSYFIFAVASPHVTDAQLNQILT